MLIFAVFGFLHVPRKLVLMTMDTPRVPRMLNMKVLWLITLAGVNDRSIELCDMGKGIHDRGFSYASDVCHV